MILDVITFTIANKKFAADLQKVPIILSADQYLPYDFTLINPNYFFYYNQYEIELLNLAKLLELDNCKVDEKTKILVGQNGNEMFGFLVDEVNEIINLNGEIEANLYEYQNNKSKYILGELNIFGEKLEIIKVEEILKNKIQEF